MTEGTETRLVVDLELSYPPNRTYYISGVHAPEQHFMVNRRYKPKEVEAKFDLLPAKARKAVKALWGHRTSRRITFFEIRLQGVTTPEGEGYTALYLRLGNANLVNWNRLDETIYDIIHRLSGSRVHPTIFLGPIQTHYATQIRTPVQAAREAIANINRRWLLGLPSEEAMAATGSVATTS